MRHSLLLCLLLAGCAPGLTAPASQLAKPAPRLMEEPKALPVLKAGDDLFDDSALCSAEHAKLAAQVRGLQTYARTVTQSKKK